MAIPLQRTIPVGTRQNGIPEWRLIVAGGTLQVQKRLDDAFGAFQRFETMTTFLWLDENREMLRLPENFLIRYRVDPSDVYGRYVFVYIGQEEESKPNWRLGAEGDYLVFQQPRPGGEYVTMFSVTRLMKI